MKHVTYRPDCPKCGWASEKALDFEEFTALTDRLTKPLREADNEQE